MKLLTLILSIFLSLFAEDRTCSLTPSEPAVEQEQSQGDFCLNTDICLCLAQGYSFTASGGGSILSAKSFILPRKVYPWTGGSFIFQPFYLKADSSRTYLFSICKLRI